MRTLLGLLGAGLLLAMGLLSGCGDDDGDGGEAPTSSATAAATGAKGSGEDIILATTTSTDNSGLLKVLVPLYEQGTKDKVKVIAVGSGAAMEMGARGDADVLLVHSPAAEQAFMASGNGESRSRVMYNDFLIVGPPADAARIKGAKDAAAAMSAIAKAEARFVSRGDDSGTHAKERELWAAAAIAVPKGKSWYAESGQGMEATLTIASERAAYTLTDRATWLTFGQRERLPLLVESDAKLFNVYHVIVVSPRAHPKVKADAARRFRDFLLKRETLEAIAAFGKDRYGQSLFVPYPE